MKLQIRNEFSPLKSVVVCWADELAEFDAFKSDDPEYTKYHGTPWDKQLYLRQQQEFFDVLRKYGVELIFPETKKGLTQQVYTRDTGFVIGDRLYYSQARKFSERNGEDVLLLKRLDLTPDQVIAIAPPIEGGDVLVTPEIVYVGLGSRTSREAADILATRHNIKTFMLGDNVMHLDTRFTILPHNYALCVMEAFTEIDLMYLSEKYHLIDVSLDEAKRLGTNVFVINPETIVVPTEQPRIGNALREKGFRIESVDYTEPISLGGSFRCTTMPLYRE